MRILKFLFSLLTTLALIYFLNNRWVIGNDGIPPLGKFLDPFQGFWQNIEPNDYTLPQNLTIPGLKDNVTVVFDSLLVPHIFANNDEDLYLAQGYITAMHRLWQMEFQTHAAAGRLSEILGKARGILEYDRTQRRLGMVYAAQNSMKGFESDPASRMMIEKYTEGINQYMATLKYKNFPFEYKLLDYQPEAWTKIKSGLLLKNMAQTLCMGSRDMQLTNALKIFGKDVVDLLYPENENVEDPVVHNPGGWKFNPITLDSENLALPDELIKVSAQVSDTWNNAGIGSNNWAVSGSKTTTGSPILCSDPHLKFSLPSLWYVIQLHSPNVNVMGFSLPGAPAIVIGFNDSIAWAVTNAERDVVDWYKITFEDENKNRYLLDNEWVATKKVVEEFKIRGSRTYYDTIIYTHWGPVTYDETFFAGDNRKHYAFRWIAHDVSNELLTFHKLNRAKNHNDYLEALHHFSSPAQNFAYASVSGDVAMRIQGKFPVRRKEEGRFVLDGSKRSNGWQAFIPNEHAIAEKNPERGFVSSANQYPVDATYPYAITPADYYFAYRNRRINSILRETDKVSIDDLMKLQNDNYNLKAKESTPGFMELLEPALLNESEKKAFSVLTRWNYFNDKESEGASYYSAWLKHIKALTWDEMADKETMLLTPTDYITIKLIKEQPGLSFFDMQATTEKETAREVVRKAFSMAVEEMESWKKENKMEKAPWADYGSTLIRHLLRIPALSNVVRTGGDDNDIVNAIGELDGPSFRMVVSLEKTGVRSWGVYPGGQSGNAGSKYYDHLIDPWADGKYFPLLFMHSETETPEKILFSLEMKGN